MEIEEHEDDINHICPILEILNSKWSYLIMAELDKGPRRFLQLQRDVRVIKTQSLTNSLRHLEEKGLVHREVIPTIPVTVEYSLTEKGLDFLNTFREMGKWTEKWGVEVVKT